MGRRKKKTYEKKDQVSASYRLEGGSRDGESKKMVFPPVKAFRVPDWTSDAWETYEFVADPNEDGGGYFRYIGDVELEVNMFTGGVLNMGERRVK